MNVFPYWTCNRTKVVEDYKPNERHKWICKTLFYRKKIEAARRNVSEIDDYKSLFANLCDCKTVISENPFLIEIISDGLEDCEEPTWYGLIIENGMQKILEEGRHQRYVAKVKKNRHSTDALPFKTHIAIGEILYNPTLFLVAQKQVWYLTGNQWSLLDDIKSPLPVICRTNLKIDCDSDADATTVFFDVHNLKSLYESEEYKVLVGKVKESLLGISESVIWPALLERDKCCPEAYMSLVLINSSTWDVPGVWALHTECKALNISKDNAADIGIITALTGPVLSSIHDVIGAFSRHYSSHEERFRDLRLYQHVKRKGQMAVPGEKLPRDERRVYQRTIPYDPYKRYGEIFDYGCEHYNVDLLAMSASDSDLSKLFLLMKDGFTGFAIRDRSEKVSNLILRNAFDKSILVTEKTLLSLDRRGRGDEYSKFDKTLSALLTVKDQRFFENLTCLVLRAYAIAVATSIVFSKKGLDAEVKGCYVAFSMLVTCFGDKDALPPRKEYNDARLGKLQEDILFASLLQAKVPSETAWYLHYLIHQ